MLIKFIVILFFLSELFIFRRVFVAMLLLDHPHRTLLFQFIPPWPANQALLPSPFDSTMCYGIGTEEINTGALWRLEHDYPLINRTTISLSDHLVFRIIALVLHCSYDKKILFLILKCHSINRFLSFHLKDDESPLLLLRPVLEIDSKRVITKLFRHF